MILDSGDFGDLTVASLAQTMRMSKSTLYKFFTSKDALVAGLIDDRCDGALTYTEDLETYTQWAIATGRFLEQIPSACLRQPEHLAPTSVERVVAIRQRLETRLCTILERAVADYTGPRPSLMAPVVVTAAWHAATLATASEGRAETVSATLKILRKGLNV